MTKLHGKRNKPAFTPSSCLLPSRDVVPDPAVCRTKLPTGKQVKIFRMLLDLVTMLNPDKKGSGNAW